MGSVHLHHLLISAPMKRGLPPPPAPQTPAATTLQSMNSTTRGTSDKRDQTYLSVLSWLTCHSASGPQASSLLEQVAEFPSFPTLMSTDSESLLLPLKLPRLHVAAAPGFLHSSFSPFFSPILYSGVTLVPTRPPDLLRSHGSSLLTLSLGPDSPRPGLGMRWGRGPPEGLPA